MARDEIRALLSGEQNAIFKAITRSEAPGHEGSDESRKHALDVTEVRYEERIDSTSEPGSTFYGRTVELEGSQNAAIWQIWRITVNNGITYSSFARRTSDGVPDPAFVHVWSERVLLFVTPAAIVTERDGNFAERTVNILENLLCEMRTISAHLEIGTGLNINKTNGETPSDNT